MCPLRKSLATERKVVAGYVIHGGPRRKVDTNVEDAVGFSLIGSIPLGP